MSRRRFSATKRDSAKSVQAEPEFALFLFVWRPFVDGEPAAAAPENALIEADDRSAELASFRFLLPSVQPATKLDPGHGANYAAAAALRLAIALALAVYWPRGGKAG